MTRAVRTLAVVAAGLWVGIVFCIGFVSAPYLFILAARHSPLVPHTDVAAAIIGPLLHGADLLSIVAGLGLLVALGYLRRRGEVPLAGRLYLAEMGAALAVVCAAVNAWGTTPRLQAVKAQIVEKYSAYHLAARSDPLVHQFGALHGASTLVFMVGFVGALACLVCLTQFRSGGGPTAATAG